MSLSSWRVERERNSVEKCNTRKFSTYCETLCLNWKLSNSFKPEFTQEGSDVSSLLFVTSTKFTWIFYEERNHGNACSWMFVCLPMGVLDVYPEHTFCLEQGPTTHDQLYPRFRAYRAVHLTPDNTDYSFPEFGVISALMQHLAKQIFYCMKHKIRKGSWVQETRLVKIYCVLFVIDHRLRRARIRSILYSLYATGPKRNATPPTSKCWPFEKRCRFTHKLCSFRYAFYNSESYAIHADTAFKIEIPNGNFTEVTQGF